MFLVKIESTYRNINTKINYSNSNVKIISLNINILRMTDRFRLVFTKNCFSHFLINSNVAYTL